MTIARGLVPALAVALVWAVAACGSTSRPRVCTRMDCVSAVTFAVSEDLVRGESYSVEACAGTHCRTASITVLGDDDVVAQRSADLELIPQRDAVRLHLPAGDDGQAREVSLTIHDGDGHRIVDAAAQADFSAQRPNGPGCPPVCWVAEVAA